MAERIESILLGIEVEIKSIKEALTDLKEQNVQLSQQIEELRAEKSNQNASEDIRRKDNSIKEEKKTSTRAVENKLEQTLEDKEKSARLKELLKQNRSI